MSGSSKAWRRNLKSYAGGYKDERTGLLVSPVRTMKGGKATIGYVISSGPASRVGVVFDRERPLSSLAAVDAWIARQVAALPTTEAVAP